MARNPPGRPRAEPLADQRRRILDVARQSFTDLGYEVTTISQIAADARVSRATVHEIFGDKQRLACAVMDELADEFVAAVDRHLAAVDRNGATRDTDHLVRNDVVWSIELLCADPSTLAMIRLAAWLGRDADTAAGRVRQRVEDQIADLYRSRVRGLGIVRGASAQLIGAAVVSLVEAAATRIADHEWPVEQAAGVVAEFVAGGYLYVESYAADTLNAFDQATADDES